MKNMPFIKMTWPWRKLFKEFILGEQNFFFSFLKKKKKEREREREKPLFFKDVGFMQLPKKFTWLGALLHTWTHRFQLKR